MSAPHNQMTSRLVLDAFLRELEDLERIGSSLLRAAPGSLAEAELLSPFRSFWTTMAARTKPGPGLLRGAIGPVAGLLLIDAHLKAAWVNTIDILVCGPWPIGWSKVPDRQALALTLGQLALAKKQLVRLVTLLAEHPAPEPPPQSPSEPVRSSGHPATSAKLTLAELIEGLELYEQNESRRDDEDGASPPPDHRDEDMQILIGKPGFRAFADICAHSTRKGLPEAQFAKTMRDNLAIELDLPSEEIGRLDVREAIARLYGFVPLSAEPFKSPPFVPSESAGATKGEQGPAAPAEEPTDSQSVPNGSTGPDHAGNIGAYGVGNSVDADWPELFKRTAELLSGKAEKQLDLIRFLLAQNERAASLQRIVRDCRRQNLHSARQRTAAERVARRHVERTRVSLEAKGCPLRLQIHASVVRLIGVS